MIEHLRGMPRCCQMLILHVINERLLGLANTKTCNGNGSKTGTVAETASDDRAWLSITN